MDQNKFLSTQKILIVKEIAHFHQYLISHSMMAGWHASNYVIDWFTDDINVMKFGSSSS